MDIAPETVWNRLAVQLRGRTSLVIGKTDAGKTTLARYLIRWFLVRQEQVCLVDADIGQSSLGPPGTISMKVFREESELVAATPDRMYFTGTVNPSKVFREMVAGTARMVNAARETGVKTIVVDTTGLVGGPTGKALKLAKAKAIRPEEIIALEREGEIEHILFALGELKNVRVHRLKASPHAARRSPARRVRYRDERYRSYFRSSRDTGLNIETIEFTFRGRAFDINASPLVIGTVVGLNRGDETLALGVYQGLANGTVIVKTLLKNSTGLTRIVASDIILKPDSAPAGLPLIVGGED